MARQQLNIRLYPKYTYWKKEDLERCISFLPVTSCISISKSKEQSIYLDLPSGSLEEEAFLP